MSTRRLNLRRQNELSVILVVNTQLLVIAWKFFCCSCIKINELVVILCFEFAVVLLQQVTKLMHKILLRISPNSQK